MIKLNTAGHPSSFGAPEPSVVCPAEPSNSLNKITKL
jgi:hypothetical protein